MPKVKQRLEDRRDFSRFLQHTLSFLITFLQLACNYSGAGLQSSCCHQIVCYGGVDSPKRWPGVVELVGVMSGSKEPIRVGVSSYLVRESLFARLVSICRRQNLHVDLSFRIEEL